MKQNKVDYYLNQFEKIKAGQMTWNWSACFAGLFWLIYRKMYTTSIVYMTIPALYLACVLFLAFAYSMDYTSFIFTNMNSIGIPIGVSLILTPLLNFLSGLALVMIPNVILGILGNRIYYRSIKRRIKKGYHLIRTYDATDCLTVSLMLFLGFVVPFLTSYELSREFALFFQFALLLIRMGIDFYKLKYNKEPGDLSEDSTEDNIAVLISGR